MLLELHYPTNTHKEPEMLQWEYCYDVNDDEAIQNYLLSLQEMAISRAHWNHNTFRYMFPLIWITMQHALLALVQSYLLEQATIP